MTDRDLQEPPMMLDGARVLEYARLVPDGKASGSVSALAGGVAVNLDSVRGVVMTEDLVKGSVYLLHTNDDWETVAADAFPDREAARAAAERAYGSILGSWTKYRELTAEEAAEVESTRRFLREIAED